MKDSKHMTWESVRSILEIFISITNSIDSNFVQPIRSALPLQFLLMNSAVRRAGNRDVALNFHRLV